MFEEHMTHELAHYFYGLTPEVPDRTHDLGAEHGVGFWLPHFLEEYVPPKPHESEEATKWQLFMQTLSALLSTFRLTKSEEQKIKDSIAEQFSDPEAPQEPPEIPTPAPPPQRSHVTELAYAMELVETRGRDPKTLGVRLNNPGCLKFATWQKEYGAVLGTSGFAKFPTYGLGKQAQLRLLRSAMYGRMPAYNANGTIKQFIYQYANSSPEQEKANYVLRICAELKIPSTTILKTLL
jgi:hypothetical protein